MEYFCHIPCGHSIPENNPHAVSVSLPTIAQVIGYEQSDPAITSIMQSAYPRFRNNCLVQKACNHVKTNNTLPEDVDLIPVSSLNAVSIIERHINKKLDLVSCDEIDFIAIRKDSQILNEVTELRQHSGLILSSRKAEDFLLRNKIAESEFSEKIESEGNSTILIKKTLSEAYGNTSVEDVFLCTSGSNAFYSAFEALKVSQAKDKRNIFVQLGWLYLDSMEIIRKYSDKHSIFVNITDLESLETYIKQNHSEIACVITEVPNNPLIQTPDLPCLSRILKQFNIPLLIDSTIATPFNVEIMDYADVVVESLTKYACGNADVMMGAVLLNKSSQIAQSVKEPLKQINEIPYTKDIRRLAEEIKSYKNRVMSISENTLELVSFLNTSVKIKHIHWALEDLSAGNYKKIMKTETAVPGLISVIFDRELQYYYDRLPLAKGPSFGTEFTLAMPYIYMAHYDLLKNNTGKTKLKELGINPELLRISVGLEPVSEIIRIFEDI